MFQALTVIMDSDTVNNYPLQVIFDSRAPEKLGMACIMIQSVLEMTKTLALKMQ